MTTSQVLIVNADDFGQSAGVNRGIIKAFECGIVTSASLMVRWPGADEAAAYAADHPDLSVGLHLDLAEWTCRDGSWTPIYQVVPANDADAVRAETARQLAAFRCLLGRDPTHLDSHQHIHRQQPALGVVRKVAQGLKIPLRHFHPQVQYCGDFYGQFGKGEPFPEAISVDSLIRIVTALPPGVTEMGCHPGLDSDVPALYCREREQEVETLCDPRVRAAIEANGICLRSFGNFAAAL
jgi:predicted glycoside hydrolase/deacetylase ChbG (UPF0249 family)